MYFQKIQTHNKEDTMKYKDFFSEVAEGQPVKLVGGVGDATAPSDVNPAELAMGVTIEMEHTNDPDVATEIALDHLTDVPDYYSKLKAAGLAKELDACNTSSGFGDPTHRINDKKRLGETMSLPKIPSLRRAFQNYPLEQPMKSRT